MVPNWKPQLKNKRKTPKDIKLLSWQTFLCVYIPLTEVTHHNTHQNLTNIYIYIIIPLFMDNSIYMTYFGVGIKKRTYRNMTFVFSLHHINFGMHIQHLRVSQLPSCNYKLFPNFSTSFFLSYKTYNIADVHLSYITLFYKIYNVGEHIYTQYRYYNGNSIFKF